MSAAGVSFGLGSPCLAKWTDGHWYKAVVQAVLPSDPAAPGPRYSVVFPEYGADQYQVRWSLALCILSNGVIVVLCVSFVV